MKKCNACGSSQSDDVMNCPNCGSSNFTAEFSQQPMNQMQSQPMPNYPMGQQPMPGPNVPTGNMSMTYATVYMVFVGLSTLSSISSLLKDFNIGTLAGTAFSAAVVFFLYKRAKIGRILAMIQNVLQAIIGGFLVAIGLLVIVGASAIDFGLAVAGGVLGGIFLVFGAFFLAFGICSFIYFKKRECMYVN